MRLRRCESALVVAAVAAGAALGGGCQQEERAPEAARVSDWDQFPDPVYSCPPSLATKPGGDLSAPIPDPGVPRSVEFSVTIDPAHRAFDTDQLQPLWAVATASGGNDGLSLRVAAKRQLRKPDVLWVEFYFVNAASEGWGDVQVEFAGLDAPLQLIPYDEDVWSEPTAHRSLALGGVSPEGVSRLIVGIGGFGEAPIDMSLRLTGKTTRRVAVSSSTLAVTPDGAEVWAPFADANLLSVVDTHSRERVAQAHIEGGPRAVAITPQGDRVLAVVPGCNQLVVLDRASRKIVQRFGEADGIGREPHHVAVSSDGTLAVVSSYVGDSLTVLERRTGGFTVKRTSAVGRRPSGLSITPDGRVAVVSHFLPRGAIDSNEAWISSIDLRSGERMGETVLPDDGNPSTMRCMQAIPGFDTFSEHDLSMEGVSTALWTVAMLPSGNEALVPSHRIVPFPIFEGNNRRAVGPFRQGSISTANIVPLKTHDPRAILPRQLDSVHQIPDRDPSLLRCLQPGEIIEFATAYPQPDRPGTLKSFGAIRPTGTTPLFETGQIRAIAFSRGARRALLLSYTSDEIAVVDAATWHPTATGNLTLSGSNPHGIAVSPDGNTAYVAYDNSTHLSVIDLAAYAEPLPGPAFVPFWLEPNTDGAASASMVTLRHVTRDVSAVPKAVPITEVAQVALVDADPMDPVLRRGKVLFSSANPDKYPQLSVHREASCSNCHPDGGDDGSMWPTIEGERRTLSLRGGVNGRGWLHASATYAGIYEFVDIVTRQRLGGTGLSSDDRDALARYVSVGIPRHQHPVVDEALAARGQRLFAQNCTSCHAGPRMTSGSPSLADPYGGPGTNEPLLVDLGTARDRMGVVIGPAFTRFFSGTTRKIVEAVAGDRDLGPNDFVFEAMAAHQRPERPRGHFKAPSLINVWDRVLLFHDGRFTRLEDAVAHNNEVLGLGLTEQDIAAIVEYLRTL